MGVGGQHHALAAFPRKRPGNHCVGSWVGPTAGLKVRKILHAHRNSIPGPSSPKQATIMTELSKFYTLYNIILLTLRMP
jgi:hypothetical protein